ncbi:VOC family protein [Leptospira sp. GIMC2001]|uniref:VOC family protein n=1 Tax=Leptospira sp. GIMC2001 TaxID=1513297 RepID=UPI00234AE728|nr:VOC family protein [Leptospira sp. GIMC2001]WCL51301.1 VOC family protein [Leptospira sp. GIMC2001]
MIIVEGLDHVNIPVSNMEASKEFYSDLFDFEVEEEEGDAVVMGLDSHKLRLVKVSEVTPLPFPTVSFIMDVDDFTEAITEMEEKNIKILRGPEGSSKGEFLVFADPDQNQIEIFYRQ